MNRWFKHSYAAVFIGLIPITFAQAQDVWITSDMPFLEFESDEGAFFIERNQDNDAQITGMFTKTSRPCPPFCIQPLEVAKGVRTVAEIELLDFLQDYVETGRGYLIDARLESFYRSGTIPGAISMPFNVFAPVETNPFLDQTLSALGAKTDAFGQWSFDDVAYLLLFCNGPWCGQSPQAIKNLISLGYPADHLFYYRGGMQVWSIMGLSIMVPG